MVTKMTEKKKRVRTKKPVKTVDSNVPKSKNKGGNPGKGNVKTIEEIKAALKACMGFYTIAAEKLGISGASLNYRINSSEELQEYIKELNVRNVHFTESKLMKNIDSGNVTAQIFYLKCKGGYREQQSLELSQKEGNVFKIERRIVHVDRTKD